MINLPENVKFDSPNLLDPKMIDERYDNIFTRTVRGVRQLNLQSAHIDLLQWIGRLVKGNDNDSYYNEIEFIKIKISNLEFHSDLYRIANEIFRTIPYQCFIAYEYNYNGNEIIKYCASTSHISARDSDGHVIENIVLSQWIYPDFSPRNPNVESELVNALYSDESAKDVYEKMLSILKTISSYDSSEFQRYNIKETSIDSICDYIFNSNKYFSENGLELVIKNAIKEDSFHCKFFLHDNSKYKVDFNNAIILYEKESVWRAFKKQRETCAFLDKNNIKTFDELKGKSETYGDVSEYDIKHYTKNNKRKIQIPDKVFISGDVSEFSLDDLMQYRMASEIIVCPENKKYDSRNACNAIIETSTNTLICGCKNTIIPDDVVKIGKSAFYCSGLKTIEIPGSITEICSKAFAFCQKLENIFIPDNVIKIGESAFNSCTDLKSAKLSEKITEIPSAVFCNCSKLEKITIPEIVTKIKERAFSHCANLKDMKLPKSVTKIEKKAFSHCANLKSMKLPKSVTEICDDAFSDCSQLEDLVVPESVSLVGKHVFANCYNLKNITIPNSIFIKIQDVFSEHNNIKSVVLLDGVTKINRAFSEIVHLSLENVEIPKTVTEIGDMAFYNCAKLKNIMLPNSVEKIDYRAFSYCSNLENIVFSKNLIEIGEESFSYCLKLKKIEIPESVGKIGEKAFWGCTKLETAIVPATTKIIEDLFINGAIVQK